MTSLRVAEDFCLAFLGSTGYTDSRQSRGGLSRIRIVLPSSAPSLLQRVLISPKETSTENVCRIQRASAGIFETGARGYYGKEFLTVEGSDRPRRHRHVTISPSRRHDTNGSGDVTKIEVVLEEAPDAVLVGSMSSELDATSEINSTFADDIAGTGTVVVRAEEVLIVVLVLVLWVAAIALFFNRWGKIRMLEPYQPKFQQQHRQSCAIVDPNPLQHRSYSKFNIHCLEHPVHQLSCASGGPSRLRQNSVFVGSSASLLPASQETPRRAKSAFDLQSLVLAECVGQDDEEQERDVDIVKTLKPFNGESSRFLQRERRPSAYQFDRTDAVLPRPLQYERGLSVYQFDRMDVLARPLQRDRGMSICHFDRMDVLTRPLQRDRGNSVCHFDRMDVLARPLPLSKSLLRERRVSVCNFLERNEEAAGRSLQRDRRLSVSNVDKIEILGKSPVKEARGSSNNVDVHDAPTKCAGRERSNAYHFDRPSCSKTSDVVLGYKATCV